MTVLTEELEKRYKSIFKCGVTVFSVCSAVWLALSVTLLLLSKNGDYTPYMAADMVLSVAYGWYAVWYFTNPFRDTGKIIKLLAKMRSSLCYTEMGKVLCVEPITKDGVTLFKVKILGKTGERELDLLPEYGNYLSVGESYVFKTRANVVVNAEAAYEE